MINVIGGTHALICTGEAGPCARLHGDCYGFNDGIIPVGLRYRTSFVDYVLPVAKEF